MSIIWSGPTGGLGNRMLALASASAMAKILDSEISFTWINSPVCPCEYNHLFEEIPGLRVSGNIPANRFHLKTHGWNPVNILDDFRRKFDKNINESDYYFKVVQSLRAIRYSSHISQKQEAFSTTHNGRNRMAVHIRRTDRTVHHKALLKQKLSILRIVKNTGILKSLQYIILPDTVMSRIEDSATLRILKQFLSQNPEAGYTLFCDSQEEYIRVKNYFKSSDISDTRYYCGYKRSGDCEYWQQSGIRKTSVADALVDLLSMSESSGIAQNNPASTFSLVASIIGRVQILSKQPSHEFWRRIETVLGVPPNRVGT